MHRNMPEPGVHKPRPVAYLSMVEAVLILGGFLILIGFFMDWVSYHYVDQMRYIKGSEFGRTVGSYPETYLLPFLGVLFIAGGFFSAGRRRAFAPQRISRGLYLATAWIGAIIAMIFAVWLTIRFSDFMRDTQGITMYNNLDFGWYVTLSGTMVLYIGCILAVSARARQLGVSDYYFVRSDSSDKPTEPMKPMPYPPMMPGQRPPMQGPPPQRPPQQGPPMQGPPPQRPPQQGPPPAGMPPQHGLPPVAPPK